MHGGTQADKAFASAQEYCAKYGKKAKITGVTVQDYSGDPVTFQCE